MWVPGDATGLDVTGGEVRTRGGPLVVMTARGLLPHGTATTPATPARYRTAAPALVPAGPVSLVLVSHGRMSLVLVSHGRMSLVSGPCPLLPLAPLPRSD